ncbi:MAG: PilZ domain-containing protein [Myxococcaceae bacterium]|nr:PilZ domain-containing protein [Myxococcaceae bacterium]
MNRRVATRKPRRLKVLYGTDVPSQPGFTQNLSETGMFITSAQLPRLGTRLAVKVETSETKEAVVACEVVRQVHVPLELRAVERPGFGVRLLGDAAPLKALLDQERRAPGAPAHRLTLATREAFVTVRESELSRGGLSFHASTAVALNATLDVLVVLGWCGRHQAVSGRTVHVRPLEQGFHVILVLDDAAKALEALDRLATTAGP